MCCAISRMGAQSRDWKAISMGAQSRDWKAISMGAQSRDWKAISMGAQSWDWKAISMGVQSRDSENVQHNLEIALILRLHGIYIYYQMLCWTFSWLVGWFVS